MAELTVPEAAMVRLKQTAGEFYFPIGEFSEALRGQRISKLFYGGQSSLKTALGIVQSISIYLRCFEGAALEDQGFSDSLRRRRKAWKLAEKSCAAEGLITGENSDGARAGFEIYYGWLRDELQRGTHPSTAATFPWNAVASWSDLLIAEVKASARK